MTATVRASPPSLLSANSGPQQKSNVDYHTESTLPSHIKWPPFVPAAPHQIDCVLYTLALSPTAMADDTCDEEISQYIVIQQEAMTVERALLEEHQLMVDPESRFGAKKQEGSSDYQWKRPSNIKDIMALRDARIKHLEYTYLDLRIRRAHLEITLLERETASSRKRLAESLRTIQPFLSLSSRSTASTSSSSHFQDNPTSSSIAVSHPSLSKRPNFNDPGPSRTRF